MKAPSIGQIVAINCQADQPIRLWHFNEKHPAIAVIVCDNPTADGLLQCLMPDGTLYSFHVAYCMSITQPTEST